MMSAVANPGRPSEEQFHGEFRRDLLVAVAKASKDNY
jgi:hypothetical protein